MKLREFIEILEVIESEHVDLNVSIWRDHLLYPVKGVSVSETMGIPDGKEVKGIRKSVIIK